MQDDHGMPRPIPVGMCQCGCGGKAPLAVQTRTSLGHVQGEPVRYIKGHFAKKDIPQRLYEVRDCGHSTPCWIWQRHIDPKGYGRTGTGLAHISEWMRRHGPVPEGKELDHLCSNPACINPDHLEPVTHIENLRRGKGTILTASQVTAIRASDEDALVLAERYGVARPTIYGIRHRRIWKDVA